MELMTEYGMKPIDVLRSATSVNAAIFGYANKLGSIRKGLLADLVAVDGDPSKNIADARNVRMVMKNGIFYK
jgi:imidazolonepropionase-like amidohydrolase